MIATLGRTVVLYFALIVGVRIMGKRQIGELQAGELVVTILISELATIPLQDMNRPVLVGIASIFTLISLELLMSAVALKSSRVRRAMSGTPTIVIRNGKIDQKALRSLRMTADDLTEALRQINQFHLENVDFAIVETNGQISAIPKPDQLPATAEMVRATPCRTGLPCAIIIDGVLQPQSMDFVAWDSERVRRYLKKKHLNEKDIFLMVVDGADQILLIPKEG